MYLDKTWDGRVVSLTWHGTEAVVDLINDLVFKNSLSIGVPGKPLITNSEYEVDRENFILTWNAPQYNGGDNNTKYRLEWRKKPITEDTEVGAESNIGETRFKITGLEPDADYEIRLYSVNRQGDSEPDIRTFKTNADAGKYCNNYYDYPKHKLCTLVYNRGNIIAATF